METKKKTILKILNVAGLAKTMNVSRQSIHAFLRESRIKPDYEDNSGKKFWKLQTAQRLAELHEFQKNLPSRSLRKYE